MKKIKYLLFIFMFVVFVGLKMDLVKAYFQTHYSGCDCALEPIDTLDDYIVENGKVVGQMVEDNELANFFGCTDPNFKGWKVYGKIDITDVNSESVEFGKSLFEPYQLINNTYDGEVYKFLYMVASDENGKDIVNCTPASNNNNNSNNNNTNNNTNNTNNNSNNNNTNNNTNNNSNKGSTTINTIEKQENCASRTYPNCNVDINKNDQIDHYCVANNEYKFCSNNGLVYLQCGDAYDIPEMVPKLTSFAVTFLKTVVPIILIIVSVIQLVKSITSGKEDDMKKAQNSLIKKIIAAAIVFFVVSIVQFVMLKVAPDDDKENLSSCLSCFLNGTGKCGNLYYKDGYGYCYDVEGHNKFKCGS